MKKNVLLLLLVIAVVAGVFSYRHYQERQLVKEIPGQDKASEQAPGDQAQTAPETQKAPDIRLRDLSGKTVSLSDLRGKVVLLNFWTTWCPYCKVEMPELEKTYQKDKDKGFVVLAVNITAQEKSLGVVRDFISQKGYHFPVLLDEDGEVSLRYSISSIPTSFIINRDGNIIDAKIGPFAPLELDQRLKGVI